MTIIFPVGYAGSMTMTPPAKRTDQARAELDPTHRTSWKAADIKAATGQRRKRARIAKPGTVFTNDPQAMAPTYVPER